MVKNLPSNARDAGHACSIPGSRRFSGLGNSNILPWKILWTEKLGGLQSMGFEELDMT